MKITDAFWEKRNLGAETVEFILESGDNADVLTAVAKNEKEYNVLKIPPNQPVWAREAQENGYRFVECSYHVEHHLAETKLHQVQARLSNAVAYALMQESDKEVLFAEIQRNMFDTDRIYLDSCFTKEQAAGRYINWIKDEIAGGAELYKLIYKDMVFGFFTFKGLGAGAYYPFLAGVYGNYRQAGLGVNTVLKPLEEARRQNGKMVSTYISSNNMAVVTLHLSVGFIVKGLTYVFTKHK